MIRSHKCINIIYLLKYLIITENVTKSAIASHKSYIIGNWMHHANEELTYLGYAIYHITPRRLTLI